MQYSNVFKETFAKHRQDGEIAKHFLLSKLTKKQPIIADFLPINRGLLEFYLASLQELDNW